jgi:hypothetical protein
MMKDLKKIITDQDIFQTYKKHWKEYMVKDYIIKDPKKACDIIYRRYMLPYEPNEFKGCLFIYNAATERYFDINTAWDTLQVALITIANYEKG